MPSCRFWRFISLASTVTVLISQQIFYQNLGVAQTASQYARVRPVKWSGWTEQERQAATFPNAESACRSFEKLYKGTYQRLEYTTLPYSRDINGASCYLNLRLAGGGTEEFVAYTHPICPIIKGANGREINYIYANKGVCVLPKEISQNESNQYIDTQNNGLLFRIVGTTLQKIWANRRLFLNWLKANQSLEKISKPLSHAQARQIIENARKLGMRVDVNPRGLAGQEITGQWAGIPHFKIENVHIPVQPGFVP